MVFPILTIIGIGIVVVLSSFYEKSWTYNWNGIRQQIKDSVKVAEYGGISTGIVGYDARKPAQFDRRHWIMQNASESELLKLTVYPNGTIKTIAYEGLIKKLEFENKTNLILDAIADTEYHMYLQSGCTGTPMHIGEYLVDFVLQIDDRSPPFAREKPNYGLTKNDEEIILTEYRKVPSLWKK
ncbi:hypothetical protein [Flavivirga spongiicola]|uniref:DUF4178 domain-containing protein n=2 Tax=Flavivirga spongiicola TaxID=421621 RepID=A0ABU7XSK1_9FLAO|nr:hypothetical protein [Flavivirga sp. MEBiC05379]MDO5978570.1 hypothetical protein [Flavivirga sp. MEBiC05379]